MRLVVAACCLLCIGVAQAQTQTGEACQPCRSASDCAALPAPFVGHLQKQGLLQRHSSVAETVCHAGRCTPEAAEDSSTFCDMLERRLIADQDQQAAAAGLLLRRERSQGSQMKSMMRRQRSLQEAAQEQQGRRLRAESMASVKLTLNVHADLDRLVVAVYHAEDMAWMDEHLSDIPHVMYQTLEPGEMSGAQHRTHANKGSEAMGYLQFILDYWERLPATIAFIHGHRHSWHLDDHVAVLRRLRWGQVPYANLRYRNGPHDRLRWKCRGHTEDMPYKDLDCNWVGSWLHPTRNGSAGAGVPMNDGELLDSVELGQVWEETFERELGELPATIHGPCCAEFVVSRDRIRAHPREFYEHLRDWILETEIGSYRCGRLFEYMWPLIFGEAAVTYPVEECDLLHCTAMEEASAAMPTAENKREYIVGSSSYPDIRA